MDSCSFIDLIKRDVGDPTEPDRQNDIWYIQQCLKSSRAGEIEVVTSMLTITEVRRGGDNQPNDEVKKLIRSVLTSGRIVTLAEMTLGVAEKARDLHWDHGIILGGADSIHVATAILTGCKEFFTTDARKKSPLAYVTEIGNLGLRVIRAADTRLLPAEYLQADLLGEDEPTPLDPAS